MAGSPLGDFLGWWLAFLLPALALTGPFRRSQAAAQAYLFAVLLHIAVAAIYTYYTDMVPENLIRGDAHSFHKYAVSRQWMLESSFAVGSAFYKEYLAHVYRWVGPSFFFASVLSIYAFALSVFVLVRFMELLNIDKGKGFVVLLFGILPSSVLYGTVPLREPYQILFFMLACYFMLRFRLSRQPLHLIAAIMFALMMGLLHKGLILYAPFLILVMLLVRVDHPGSRSTANVYLLRFAEAALAVGIVVGMSAAAPELEEVGGTEVLRRATTLDALVEYASEHRDKPAVSEHRTSYAVELNTSSPVRFVYSSVRIFFYYMLTPFPWKVSNLMDLYAFGEVVLRIVCLVAIFRMWRRGGPVHSQIVTLLMVVYLLIAFLWAGGTSNWGTATRHHMMHQWILLLLGIPALLEAPAFARRQPVAPRAGAPRFSEPCGTRLEPRIPHLKSLADTSLPPPRLGGRGRQAGGLQIANLAPHPWSVGPRRVRRLAEE